MTVNGKINSDGESSYNNLGGGGSGGSLLLEIGTLLGYGMISCNGGDGGQYLSGGIGQGGGGGGGRLIMKFTNQSYKEKFNNFSGTVSTYGGDGFQKGSAGTVLIKKIIQNVPKNILIIKNNNLTFLSTVITKSYKYVINEFHILGNSYVTININNNDYKNGKYFYAENIVGDYTGKLN